MTAAEWIVVVDDVDTSESAFYWHVLSFLGFQNTKSLRQEPWKWGVSVWCNEDIEVTIVLVARMFSDEDLDGRPWFRPREVRKLSFVANSRQEVDDFYQILRSIGAATLPPINGPDSEYSMLSSDLDGLQLHFEYSTSLESTTTAMGFLCAEEVF
eukprot:CAMPEP_0184645086 /NCGR_PEP_ID=MMETSP0308-20130426/1639_1 /TAXON_ID=38269 /ORGANISM="Gloeochaete witrockiana, Strain SAG 46.84" /LENGTH=154 /DNA_ID=CAMNT_0027073903 /DNA_START=321 /DNA_END=785 /DNA_ORIENTATION=+